LGVAAGAAAVALYDLQGAGFGLSAMMTALVLYLLCQDARNRIDSQLDE
jgi:hypothetical protein